MEEKNKKTLSSLVKGQIAVVTSVTAGLKAAKRLADLGITPQTEIEVLRKIQSHGPIEVRVRGSNLILGKGIASKILVKQLYSS